MNIVDKAENQMELRDRFACAALQGFMSNMAVLGEAAREEGIAPIKYASHASYEVADAMLEARK